MSNLPGTSRESTAAEAEALDSYALVEDGSGGYTREPFRYVAQGRQSVYLVREGRSAHHVGENEHGEWVYRRTH